MIYQMRPAQARPRRSRRGRLAPRRHQGLLQLRRLPRRRSGPTSPGGRARPARASSAPATRGTSRSAPTTACARTSTPTTRRCTRPAPCWSRRSCTTAGGTTACAAAEGEIVPPPPGAAPAARSAPRATPSSSSATRRSGFLVLNSWGRDWGGWTPGRGAPPVPGVALWRYDDWADTHHGRLGAAARRRRGGGLRILDRRPGARLRRRRRRPLDAGPRHPRQLPPPRRRRVRHLRRLRLHPPTLRRPRRLLDRGRRSSTLPRRAPDLRRRPRRPRRGGRARRALEAPGARRRLVPVHRPLVRRLRRRRRARCSRASSPRR